MLRYFAVILQRFFAGGFLPCRSERDFTNFQQFGSGKKQHVGRIVIERIHQAALVEDDDLKSNLLRFDGAGEAGRPGSDYEHIRALLGMRVNFGPGQSFNVFGGEKIGHRFLECRALYGGANVDQRAMILACVVADSLR